MVRVSPLLVLLDHFIYFISFFIASGSEPFFLTNRAMLGFITFKCSQNAGRSSEERRC